MISRLNVPFPVERLIPEEEIGGANAPVFVILSGRDAGSCGLRFPDIGTQLDGALAKADLGEAGIVGAGADVEDILDPKEDNAMLRNQVDCNDLFTNEGVVVADLRTGATGGRNVGHAG